jgi:N6-L-threonylcarbamoyladenine synthase
VAHPVVILGIETSCDETAAAVLIDGRIASNVVATQEIHIKYGGVLPEMASRLHQVHIVPVVNEALEKADVAKTALSAIAFTRGPGLIGCLLVGTSFAKAMALGLDIPLIAVNHMQAHVHAHFIDEPRPGFPFLCLTVSGGHTQLVLVRDYLDMEILGQTIDDAAGEAFDKTAKMIGLPYPGGPLMDKLAREGNPKAFTFPEPRVEGFDFSFSGLKTAVLYFLRDMEKADPGFVEARRPDLCASIQHTIVQTLIKKLEFAADQLGVTQVGIAGGVSANSSLRSEVERLGKARNWETFIPKFQYCTDNAAMIAMTGWLKYQAGEFVEQTVSPVARWRIGE